MMYLWAQETGCAKLAQFHSPGFKLALVADGLHLAICCRIRIKTYPNLRLFKLRFI